MNHRVGFVSLGCPKALVDSERIMTQLRSQGYELTSSYEDAGVVVVNTCGFIESAIEESLDTIREAMDQNGRVIVTGCLGTKADLIKKVCPDVLHISGAHAYEEVVRAVHEHLPPPLDPFIQLIPPQGIKLTPRHYAYLKISEGCNHKCTFCIIPSMRGKLQSDPFERVFNEALRLQQAGVKELLVISQDTSAYGLDLYKKPRFTDLCKTLGELGIWIRLHYVYPYPHVEEVIPLMRDGLILPYLDMPLQHANFDILRAMRRPANAENILKRIERFREICPEITLRSTFIVGFPGESNAAFEELLSFLKDAQLDRIGCFKYSSVEGAVANTFDHPVNNELKEERYQRFMEVAQSISYNKLKTKIGTIQTIIIDQVNEGEIIGRTKGDAPEIDGQVYLKPGLSFKVGSFQSVKIIDSDEYDLYAEPVP